MPTFCAKALIGKPLKTGDDRGGAHVGPQTGGDALAVDLGAEDLADGQQVGRRLGHDHQDHDHIETITPIWNCGAPK